MNCLHSHSFARRGAHHRRHVAQKLGGVSSAPSRVGAVLYPVVGSSAMVARACALVSSQRRHALIFHRIGIFSEVIS